MKKYVALALASMMAVSSASVAFAADEFPILVGDSGESYVYVDDNDDGKFGASETHIGFEKGDSVSVSDIKGGKKVAIPLLMSDGSLALPIRTMLRATRSRLSGLLATWMTRLPLSWLSSTMSMSMPLLSPCLRVLTPRILIWPVMFLFTRAALI